MPRQGGLDLLTQPAAQDMLQAPFPCRLAYTWPDGTPRVVPIWFHWNGTEVVMASPPDAPKLKALKPGTKVAITIDSNEWPNKVLLLRGPVEIDEVDGIAPEYAAAAHRCMGQEGGDAFLDMAKNLVTKTARLKVKPDWVGLLDFQTRFPSAMERAMGGGA